MAIEIIIRGLVQGVGFRPFIYILAEKHKIKGWVENRNDGVIIHAEGNISVLNAFVDAIKAEKPLPAQIHLLNTNETKTENYESFTIRKSLSVSDEVTEISPDICVCNACLEDMQKQEHRLSYPFINCTNCGPRFTIIKDLPYDREMTTMHPFEMCNVCRAEYSDVYDRRFHAQPIACNKCGPSYGLQFKGEITEDINEITESVSSIIGNGGLILIKGMGGFNLVCDAMNEKAVSKLRKSKLREAKPFAVMFANIESIKEYADIDDEEEKLLSGWRRPIVLLRKRKDLAQSVCNGLNTIGVMLPYMPIHFMLFEKLKTSALVYTSGNISDEPIIIDNKKAAESFSLICDGILDYNREIYNRSDDSVAIIVNKKERLIRRSRGFVPSPILLGFNAEGIFASGAELTNSFCIGKANQAIMSQYIGDLKNLETFEFYEESFERFKRLFRFTPKYAVCDLHPDYLSSRFAQSLGLPLIKVQHHHAHIASVMAEHNLNEKLIGVAMDGVGLGDDGHIWGAEFLCCDLSAYERIGHFDYIPQPGGDMVAHEPWRMTVSYLYKYFGEDFLELPLPFINKVGKKKIKDIILIIDKNINSPLSSSAGRLFDAVSALTGISVNASFHAEAPMRLEAAINYNVNVPYDFVLSDKISFEPMFKQIIEDILQSTNTSIIAAKFHHTVINAVVSMTTKLALSKNIRKVALSGGSFQNRFILNHIENALKQSGLDVYSNEQIPANDGGISLGQLAVAACRINTGKL